MRGLKEREGKIGKGRGAGVGKEWGGEGKYPRSGGTQGVIKTPCVGGCEERGLTIAKRIPPDECGGKSQIKGQSLSQWIEK